MDLSSMSLEELKQLKKDVDKAIKSFESQRLAEARRELEEKAHEMGFSLADIMGSQRKGAAKGLPAYRHPENPELTWTGRGRRPKWFVEALEAGKSEEDLKI